MPEVRPGLVLVASIRSLGTSSPPLPKFSSAHHTDHSPSLLLFYFQLFWGSEEARAGASPGTWCC